MEKYIYMYGMRDTQDVYAAQQDVIMAFDTLIEEMQDFVRTEDEAFDVFDTDDARANLEKSMRKIHARINSFTNQNKPYVTLDLEVAKQLDRDRHIAKLGAHGKRLEKLIELRTAFAETDPELTPSSLVHDAYRIFKLQIMRCATELANSTPSNQSTYQTTLHIYASALRSCNRIDESWEGDKMFPFADVEF